MSGFCSMKRLGVFLLPPGWDASPSQGYHPALNFSGTNLYAWVVTVRVKSLVQELNTMSLARAQTWTTQSRGKHTNHEATVPPTLLTGSPFLFLLGADVKLSLPLLSAKVGATVSVTCTVTGETFLGWFNDGKKVTTSPTANIRVISTGNIHTIKFVNVKLSYGGDNYQCRGSSKTETLLVHVACKYKVDIYAVYHFMQKYAQIFVQDTICSEKRTVFQEQSLRENCER